MLPSRAGRLLDAFAVDGPRLYQGHQMSDTSSTPQASGEAKVKREPKTRAEMEAVMASHEMMLRKKPCTDCAFNKRSPENEAYSGPCASEGGSMVDYLKQRVKEHDWMPFFSTRTWSDVDRDGWRTVVGIADDAVANLSRLE